MSSRKKIMITLIIILLLLTAGVYGYGVYYFTEHFLPGSMVNGFNCSYMTVSQSEELLTQKVGAYVLTIDTRNNGQESITAKQAGLSYDSDGSVDKLIRNQDRFTWFLAFNQHRNYEVSSSIKYDEQKTEAAISELKCMQQENMTEPSDAHIEEKDDKFVIVPEQEGTALKPEKTSQDIIDALVTGRTPVDLEADGCYKEPKVYQSDETLIKNGETQVREPVYSHEGLVRKTNDIGYTYIEIDLTAQRMVFYKDGTPTADAQIVSGNPFVPNCATPVGCYTTGEMKSGCTVNGEDYPSAVNYWIPFDGNLGISDAPWRMDFGGQLYEFEGTHGSICAPSDQVQIIFSNVEKNTPIVIYE